MKVRVSKSAEQNLSCGFVFYEEQTDGLGAYFLESLYADIEASHFHAGVHRKVAGYHRCNAKRFPFAIYYFVAADVVNVKGVLNSRKQPDRIRRKLRDPS